MHYVMKILQGGCEIGQVPSAFYGPGDCGSRSDFSDALSEDSSMRPGRPVPLDMLLSCISHGLQDQPSQPQDGSPGPPPPRLG